MIEIPKGAMGIQATSRPDYDEALTTYEKLVLAAIRFSDLSGGMNTTRRGIESTKIYTRITLSAMTINALLPGNYINRTRLWDFPSIAALTRTFMEVCHRYLYLSEEGLSDEEAAFRLSLYYFHLNSEKYKLYQQSNVDAETLKEFEDRLPKAKAELMDYPAYKALHKKRADDVRSGNTCMHLTDDEASLRFALLPGKFKQMYRLLSTHAHGAPFATSSQSDERGRGLENEIETAYVRLTLLVLHQYLSKAILNQAALLSLKDRAPAEFQYCVETLGASRK